MAPKKMDIIYEDKELLVVNKPSKLLTIATEKEKDHTLYHEASNYVKKQNPKNKIFIIHRLDKDTSGIIIFAKNKQLKEAFQKNWHECAKTKEYIAIIEGHLKNKKGSIINYLAENRTYQIYDTHNPKTGKKSITDYEVLGENKNNSFVKINILTGRKNQIRVAFSSLNTPILGDKKYNSLKNPYNRLALHASKLVISHPKTKKEYIFCCKIPKEFQKTFKKEIIDYEKNLIENSYKY